MKRSKTKNYLGNRVWFDIVTTKGKVEWSAIVISMGFKDELEIIVDSGNVGQSLMLGSDSVKRSEKLSIEEMLTHSNSRIRSLAG